MWIWIIAEFVITLYAGMYGWSCIRKRHADAAAGACMLACISAGMGALLILYY